MKRYALFLGAVLTVTAGCKSKPPVDESVGATRQSAPEPISSATPVTAGSPTTSAAQTQARASASSTGTPRWDWQQYDEESFETEPSQGRVFSVPEHATKLRVKLTASSPVDAAAMTRDVFKGAKGVVREDRLLALPCASIGMRKDDAKCTLNPKDSVVYVVRDQRALAGDPAAAARFEKKAAERGVMLPEMPADKVHVLLSVWACVENCGPLGGPAQ